MWPLLVVEPEVRPKSLARLAGVGVVLQIDLLVLHRPPQSLRENVVEDPAEVERLAPLVEAGGFIPHCDHRVPADVPLANYVHYVREAKRVWGKGLANLRSVGSLRL